MRDYHYLKCSISTRYDNEGKYGRYYAIIKYPNGEIESTTNYEEHSGAQKEAECLAISYWRRWCKARLVVQFAKMFSYTIVCPDEDIDTVVALGMKPSKIITSSEIGCLHGDTCEFWADRINTSKCFDNLSIKAYEIAMIDERDKEISYAGNENGEKGKEGG